MRAVTTPLLTVVPTEPLPEPPYPPDIRARGWHFQLDLERIKQSMTWRRAPAELRPWLLMLWTEAWQQSPCGALPDDDDDVAVIIGMPIATFAVHKPILMRGWKRCSDGLLYHDVITELVVLMMGSRKRDRDRKRLKGNESNGIQRTPKDSITGSGSGSGSGEVQNRASEKTQPSTASPQVIHSPAPADQTALGKNGRSKPQDGKGQQWGSMLYVAATAHTVQMPRRPNESDAEWKDRVYAEVKRRQREPPK